MNKYTSLLLLITASLFWTDSQAQGCSDAGFCTIGNLNGIDRKDDSSHKQKLSIILNNGIGDENVYVFTPAIQYDNQIGDRYAIQARLTANYASGNLGNSAGLGDLFISGIYTVPKKKLWQTSFLLGVKLPLNAGDIRESERPLPMQYQSSLGTIDLLAGISVSNSRWLISTAVQQPLSGRNRNTFLPVYWSNNKADNYIPSNDFNRKGDVLLKTVYTFNTNRKTVLNVGLLGIYHLGEDTYIDGNISNKPIAIKGSDGLTLNATAALRYKVSSRFSVGLSGGVPLVVRTARPDGLTRKFVLSPEIIYHF